MSLPLRVNGAPTNIPQDATVADLVARVVGPDAGRGVAVARNGHVVPRSKWSDTTLCAHDDVEIAAPFQGG